jgi:hypothetical protein
VEQLGCHWTDFHEISYFMIFAKSVKIQGSLKSDRNGGDVHEVLSIFTVIVRCILFRMGNISDRIYKEN